MRGLLITSGKVVSATGLTDDMLEAGVDVLERQYLDITGGADRRAFRAAVAEIYLVMVGVLTKEGLPSS